MEDIPALVITNEKTTASKTKTKGGGGITCCVPICKNNSLKQPHLSYYVIPSDPELRKKWLHKISRMNFVPSTSHRVCSEHFVGGKKTYMNNIPTIVPKTIKPIEPKPRTTNNSSGIKRCILSLDDENENHTDTPNVTLENELKDQVENLIKELEDLRNNTKHIEEKLKQEIVALENHIKNNSFTVDRFKHNEAHFKFYTGFRSYSEFRILLEYLEPAASHLVYWGSNTNTHKTKDQDVTKRGRQRKLNTEEEFFLTLVRLRCGFPLEDMAIRYNISTSHLSRILITWTDFLHSQLRMLPIWAKRNTVDDTMPKCFKKEYPTTRVIIDCTELFIEMPTSYCSQSATFSNYKHKNKAKGLVGIAPNGAVTFVSDLYAGRFSDKKITKDCGIYKLLEPGDSIMADRGFELDDDLPEGVSLNIPPFLNGKPQLSLVEEIETRRIASVRVHVERAIERVKNFRILQSTFQLTMAAELNKIWVVCCYLVNFLPQLVPDTDTA